MKRFNKQNVLDKLYQEVARLEEQWGFDPDNGYSQVANADFQKIMAYGFYEGYKSMIDSINYNSF
ncbi:MAG: hypothetical protein WCI80_01410 [Bacteroidota bacterium]